MQKIKLTAIVALAFQLLTYGAVSAAGEREEIIAQCLEALNLPDGACDCIGDKAQENLKEDQRRLLLALVSGDQESSAKLRSQLPNNEVTETVMFMVNTPTECASQ